MRLENLFTGTDIDELLKVAQITKSGTKPSKKEVQAALYIVGNNPKSAASYKSKVSEATKNNFATIYDHIIKTLG